MFKTLEAEVRHRKGKFQEACAAVNDLLLTEEDQKHVVPAVKSALDNLENCKAEAETVQNELTKLYTKCEDEVPETIYKSILQVEKSCNEAKIFCSKYDGSWC